MNDLQRCRRCPRLVAHLESLRTSHPGYHNAPVGAWGPSRSRLLIVGLAPGLHGANKTGKAFVGDSSGRTLFEALAATGWATSSDPSTANLLGAKITNVVKCLPPQNSPKADEISRCNIWLQDELQAFLPLRGRRARAVVCLGTVAYQTVRRALELGPARFEHGSMERLGNHNWLIASYHPSRQNVNTGRLTQTMLQTVFAQAQNRLA